MMAKICGVYKITNVINGKFYIGSSVDINHRKREHLRELMNGTHHNERMQNSFNKYGAENFAFEIIEEVSDVKILRDREQHWLDEKNACDRNIGFNICKTAAGGGCFGEDNPNHGNTGAKNPLSKSIAQIDSNSLEVVKIWDASIEITRTLKIHGGNICKICIGVDKDNVWKKYKSSYWCYEKDINKLNTKIDFINSQQRKVLQIDPGTMMVVDSFNSVADAARKVGIGPENISRCCKGKYKTSGGYTWEYADKDYAYERENIVSLIGDSNPRARKVVQLTIDGEYIRKFKTIKEAASLNNISTQALYVNLNRASGHVTGGYKWMYYDDYLKQ